MKYSKAIAAGSFLLCLAAGFGITKAIRGCGSGEDLTGSVQTGTTQVVSPQTPKAPNVSKEVKQVEEKAAEKDNGQAILPDVLSALEKKEKMKEAAEKKKKEKKIQEQTNEPQEPVVAEPKMSLSEIRSMLRNGAFVGADKLSPNFRIHTYGMRSGERTPESPMDVHDKLRTEQWKDFSVSNPEYDDQGRVASVTIRPIYQSEEKRTVI